MLTDARVAASRRQAPAFTVLIVCTGNICRSALAERLGRAYVAEVMGEEAGAVRVVSAGTRAVVDSAMHPRTAPSSSAATVLKRATFVPGSYAGPTPPRPT